MYNISNYLLLFIVLIKTVFYYYYLLIIKSLIEYNTYNIT